MFSATLLICSQAFRENQECYLSTMSVFTREWVSPTDLLCFTDSLQNARRRALLLIDNRQICWISTQTKLSSIYRHELIVIYCALMKHQAVACNSGETQKLQKFLLIFFLFGRDTLWRNPGKRVASGRKV